MKKLFALALAVMMVLSLGSSLAEAPVTLRVYDWSDSVLPYREQFHKEFMEKNPDIIVEYTQLTIDQFNSTVVAAIQNGDGPYLFPVPTNLNLTIADGENGNRYLKLVAYINKKLYLCITPIMC